MDDALRALLEGLVDYAGLFPPAGLDMDPAVGNYLEYRQCPERWMLARFVVPAARAGELAACLPPPVMGAAPLDLSVLARPEALDADGSVPGAGAFELRLPAELAAGGDASAVGDWTRSIASRLRTAAGGGRPIFVEAGPPQAAGAVIAGLASARSAGAAAGYKIRTGGLEPAAFPSCEDLAAAVVACRDAGVPFKATAGLHHPLRRFDASVGAPMHGFLNLFGGAVLALFHDLGRPQLEEILADEEAASWRFRDGRLSWRGFGLSAVDVRRGRAALATSFGSCSFDEPREDLRALGLLT